MVMRSARRAQRRALSRPDFALRPLPTVFSLPLGTSINRIGLYLCTFDATEALARQGRCFAAAVETLEPKVKLSDLKSEDFGEQGREFWEHDENVRLFLAFVVHQRGISGPEGWYALTAEHVKTLGGAEFLKSRGRLSEVIPRFVLGFQWLPWKFERVPHGFWSLTSNQKLYMRWLSQELGREEGVPERWYSVSVADFNKNGGKRLLALYDTSPFTLLSSLYPNSHWLPWLFKDPPNSLWEKKENHKKFLDWLGGQLGYAQRSDWYQITQPVIAQYGGNALISRYGSLFSLISSVYSDFEYLPWMFVHVPRGYWKEAKNRRAYVDWLKQQIDVGEDRALLTRHFQANHGSGLLLEYGGSPHDVIQSLLSSVEPLTGMGKKGHWDSVDNQRAFLLEFAKTKNFDPKYQDRWYQITQSDINEQGGSGLLQMHYQGSPYLLLKAAFPEMSWDPWKFKKTPQSAESDEIEYLTRILNYVRETIPLHSLDDFHRVTESQLSSLKVKSILQRAGGLEKALSKCFPDHSWKFVQRSKQ